MPGAVEASEEAAEAAEEVAGLAEARKPCQGEAQQSEGQGSVHLADIAGDAGLARAFNLCDQRAKCVPVHSRCLQLDLIATDLKKHCSLILFRWPRTEAKCETMEIVKNVAQHFARSDHTSESI